MESIYAKVFTMPYINNVTELDWTPEQLTYFEQEMRKYRLPKISQWHKKFGVPFIRFSFLPALLLIVVLGMIYMNSSYNQNQWMWIVDKSIAFFYIFFFGTFTLISHLAEKITANKLRRRLGLSHRDFNILVIAFQITGMD